MALHKDYGLIGVGNSVQLGKQGPKVVRDGGSTGVNITDEDGSTAVTLSGANATLSNHFVTKAQLDSVSLDALAADIEYNSGTVTLGNIAAGNKTIQTVFTVDTIFDGNTDIKIGTDSNNSLLMSLPYYDLTATGDYVTINTIDISTTETFKVYVTQGNSTVGNGTVVVSVLDGPVTSSIGGGGSGITSIVEDTTPQLGGNLDTNAKFITGNLIPSANSVYDLGSATNKWGSLYVTSQTIYLGETALSVDSAGEWSTSEAVNAGEGIGGVSWVKWTTSSELEIRTSNTASYITKINSFKKGDQLELLTGNDAVSGNTLTISSSTIGNVDASGYYDYTISVDSAPASNIFVYTYNMVKTAATDINQMSDADGLLSSYSNSDVSSLLSSFGSNTISTSGDITSTGVLKLDQVGEKLQSKSITGTGTFTFQCANGQIFYVSSPAADWSCNFTDLAAPSNYATAATIVISQGATPYMPTGVAIAGTGATINWQGGGAPTGTANAVDVVTFSILNVGGTYTVLGQATTDFS